MSDEPKTVFVRGRASLQLELDGQEVGVEPVRPLDVTRRDITVAGAFKSPDADDLLDFYMLVEPKRGSA